MNEMKRTWIIFLLLLVIVAMASYLYGYDVGNSDLYNIIKGDSFLQPSLRVVNNCAF